MVGGPTTNRLSATQAHRRPHDFLQHERPPQILRAPEIPQQGFAGCIVPVGFDGRRLRARNFSRSRELLLTFSLKRGGLIPELTQTPALRLLSHRSLRAHRFLATAQRLRRAAKHLLNRTL